MTERRSLRSACRTGARRAFVLPIRFYQRFLSPLKPPTCRFHPSCSEYGLRAVLAHGIVKGSLLTTWRILRCQPFCDGGFDPVPARGHWKADPTGHEAGERATPLGGDCTGDEDC